ncbi:hypothetical protein R1V46_004623 [Salmonella enterica]|nr:hypothetical protein [Salmonella enterica subsp. enterica serovar Anatum]EGM5024682.1 hypothetical protein [Salmonella enterica]ELP3058419.1 hypothetical protein [Salmonella enterica]
MLTANSINNTGVNPMNYATRIFELTVYEKLIKYAIEMHDLYNTGNIEVVKGRQMPNGSDGACSFSTFLKYVNVFYPPATGTRTQRAQQLQADLDKLVDAGFFELGLAQRGVVIYKLTDLYKTQDVNELIEG